MHNLKIGARGVKYNLQRQFVIKTKEIGSEIEAVQRCVLLWSSKTEFKNVALERLRIQKIKIIVNIVVLVYLNVG